MKAIINIILLYIVFLICSCNVQNNNQQQKTKNQKENDTILINDTVHLGAEKYNINLKNKLWIEPIDFKNLNIDTIYISKKEKIANKFTYNDFVNTFFNESFSEHSKYKKNPIPLNFISLKEPKLNVESVSTDIGFISNQNIIRMKQNTGSIYSRDSIRVYSINYKPVNIKRIIFTENDSIQNSFNVFNKIFLTFGPPLDVWLEIKNCYIYINQPMSWCGTNRNHFVIIIDPEKYVVYEFFINLNDSPSYRAYIDSISKCNLRGNK